MLPRTEPSLSVMYRNTFSDRRIAVFGRFGLVVGLMLVLAACGQQRFGQAPVVNGATGERVGAASGPAARGGTVTVRKGDSLYKIAKRSSVGLRAMIDANNLKPPYTIYPGQKLQLPNTGVHVAVRGDTIYQIAQRYGTEPGTLVRINRIPPPYRLLPGQRIVLPTGKPGATVANASAGQQTTGTVRAPTGTSRGAVSANRAAKSVPPPSRAVLPSERAVAKRAPPTSRAVKPPPASRGGFIWPVSGRLLSKFGALGKGLQNDGINILARRGTPVRAIQTGVVAYSGNELRGFGNLLLIKHSGGWISAYAHNDQLLVKTGQTVTRGQVISRVGSTGSVDKPQLHFELRRENRAVDPERYLGRRTAGLMQAPVVN
tara:strand:+ start:6349 stop:7470 length:1122 start_codon:yes stop_codon:yes gene_type:complete